jgi:hypothetical protein
MHMRVLFVATVLSILPMPVLAETIYTYTGNPFTQGFDGTTFFPSPVAPFTSNDSISGWFSVATPLGANFCVSLPCQITPTAFSFTDGVDTFTESNVMGSVFFPTGSQFFISTDVHGDIIDWSISLLIQSSPSTSRSLDSEIFGMPIDQGRVQDVFATNNHNPGTWTVSSGDVSHVPEPSTLLLVGSGIVGLAGGIRRRARKSNPSL